MIQIVCFFICPIIAVYMFERVTGKKSTIYERIVSYAFMFAIINLLCTGAIVFISGNKGFLIGDSSSYTVKFVFKYLLCGLFLSAALPYGYKIFQNRKPLSQKLYTRTEAFLTQKESSAKNYLACNKAACIVVSLSFIIFIFFMLYNLMHSALWGDEWVEYRISQLAIRNGSMYQSVISTFQPPLYNWLMHFWLKISKSILWFRLFNVALGIISGILLYLTQLAIFKKKSVACGALISLSLSYRWIYAIQECSEYALMLMFLFTAIYFYTIYKNTGNFIYECLFVLGCIGAMYSQYGAVFVVAPLLCVHFLEKIFCEKLIMNKAKTLLLYLCGLFFFAVPLYCNYLSIQMKNNKISTYKDLTIGVAEIKGLFTQLGLNIGYIWNLNQIEISKAWLSYLTIPLIIVVILISLKKYKNSALVNLSITLLLGYVMHYFLTVMHIYAMVHANESSGFYSRYSFFYIPIFAVMLPACIYIIIDQLTRQNELLNKVIGAALLTGLLCVTWTPIKQNWHKAYDDIYAKVWIDEKGYEEPTYLTGACYWDAFNYYVVEKYGSTYKNNVYDISAINEDDLPSSFWLWRTNWGGERYNEIYEKAKNEGYYIETFYEQGLSRFSKSN